MKYCIAFTKKGKKCEYKSKRNSDYCGVHLKQENKTNKISVELKGDLITYPYKKFPRVCIDLNQSSESSNISLEDCFENSFQNNNEKLVLVKREGEDHDGYCSGEEGEEFIPYNEIKRETKTEEDCFYYPNEEGKEINNKTYFKSGCSHSGGFYCNTNGSNYTILAIDPRDSPRNYQYIYEITEMKVLNEDEETFYISKRKINCPMKFSRFQLKQNFIKEYFSSKNQQILKEGLRYKRNYDSKLEEEELSQIESINYYNISKPFIKELLMSRKELEKHKLFDINALLIIGSFLL